MMSLASDSATTVMLSGPVTIYESIEIHESLVSALSAGQDLHVDLETSGPWDLAGFQLLVSVVNSAKKLDLTVRFLHIPGVCVEIAGRSGLRDWLEGHADSYV